VKVKNGFTVSKGEIYGIYSDKFNYDLGKNSLSLNGIYLFKDGIWAEIVKEEKIMIGDNEVRFKKDYAVINGYDYTKNDLEITKRVLEMPKIQSLNVGCNGQYKVDLPLINRILDKLK
jgi:uncharacterized protein YrrD